MNALNPNPDQPGNAERQARLAELLAERALHAGDPAASGELGLTSTEAAELEALRAQLGATGSAGLREQDFVAAAGAVVAAFASREATAMPAALRERIAAKGRQVAREKRGETVAFIDDGAVKSARESAGSRVHQADADRSSSQARGRASGSGRWQVSGWAGWMAAAAAVAVAVWVSNDRSGKGADRGAGPLARLFLNTPVELYDQLTGAGRSDVLAIAAHASGDDGQNDVDAQFLVDPATNEAVIRISGLPSTEGTDTRYQVWVQDAGRSESHPISGGLVSIPFEGASYVVKLAPSVPIIRPVGFAITRESRGGAVVSSPDRIVVRGALQDATMYGPFEPTDDGAGGDGSRGNEPGGDTLTNP